MTATIYGQQYGGPYWDTADDWEEGVALAEVAVDQNTWCPAVIVDDATREVLVRRMFRPAQFGLVSPCPASDDWVFVQAYVQRRYILAQLGLVCT